MRIWIVVVATDVPSLMSVREVCQVVPPSADISTSPGGLMVMSAVRSLPLTVKLCGVPAVPVVTVPRSSGPPPILMLGAVIATSVLLPEAGSSSESSVAVTLCVPALLKVTWKVVTPLTSVMVASVTTASGSLLVILRLLPSETTMLL